MKETAKIIFTAALVCAALAGAASDNYLYFQIVDSPTIKNLAGVEVPWDEYTWNNLRVTAARVVSINGDGETPLNLSYDDGGTLTDAEATMVNMGVNMPLYAALPATTSELSFAIELGNYNNGNWTTLATSGSLDYNSLKNSGYTYMPSAGDLALATLTAWAPTAYSVPEPSSGLLMLLGASLLALKRRRR